MHKEKDFIYSDVSVKYKIWLRKRVKILEANTSLTIYLYT